MIIVTSLSKSCVFKMFPSTLKRKVGFFFSKSVGLISVYRKLRFRDGSVWTVGLTVEIKLRFENVSVHTKTESRLFFFKVRQFDQRLRKAPLTRRISVDGRPNVEKELRFQISPSQCGQGLAGLRRT